MSDGPWTCFFCGDTFADRAAARAHFGGDEECAPACQIKASEGGLIKALRETEAALFDATCALHDESAEALKTWHAVGSRHEEALRSVEETAYECGLADGRGLIARFVAALKPFADCASQISAVEPDGEWAKFRLLVSDYRRAAAAIREVV